MALVPAKPVLEVPTDPWDRARERFLEDLSEKDREKFRYASLENLFYGASVSHQAYHADSKVMALHRKMKPFVEAVTDYATAMETFANGTPFVGPLLGSIRVVMQLAQDFGKYLGKLVEMFDRIGDTLPRLRSYQQLFPSYPRLMNLLTDAYLDITNFCVDVKHVFVKASKLRVTARVLSSSLWRPIQDKFGETLDTFRRHSREVEKEATVAHMTEFKKHQEEERANRELQELRRKEEERQKLLASLSEVDFARKHEDLQAVRHPGTGGWLTKDPTCRTWRNSSTSSTFICYGIPGAGKTVLASTLFDTLSGQYADQTSTAIYYYCHSADMRSLLFHQIVGSLVKQLLQKLGSCPDLEAAASNLYVNMISPPMPNKLRELLFRCLEKFHNVLLCIDGLDELDPETQANVLKAVKGCLTLKPTIKIFLTSRQEELGVRKDLQDSLSLELSSNAVDNDIRIYVEDLVESRYEDGKLKLKNFALKDEIIHALVKGAKYMFLWVKLQVDEICTASTDKEIREILKDLPSDLPATYSRILTRIAESTGGARKLQLARKAFSWIICAERPLRMNELMEAVAVDSEDKQLNIEKIPSSPERILEACGNLVHFDRIDSVITLAHYTVKQFLLGENAVLNLSLEDIRLETAKACLAYLWFSDFQAQVIKRDPVYVQLQPDLGAMNKYNYMGLPFGSTLHWLSNRIWQQNSFTAKPLLNIDVKDYVPPNSPSETLIEKYHFLDYALKCWYKHCCFRSETILAGSKLYQTVTDPGLKFEVRPWLHEPYSTAPHETVLGLAQCMHWAISYAHYPILHVTICKEDDFYREFDSQGKSRWSICETFKSIYGMHPVAYGASTNRIDVLEMLLECLPLISSYRVTSRDDLADVAYEAACAKNPALLERAVSAMFRRDGAIQWGDSGYPSFLGSAFRRAAINENINFFLNFMALAKEATPFRRTPLFLDIVKTEIDWLHAFRERSKLSWGLKIYKALSDSGIDMSAVEQLPYRSEDTEEAFKTFWQALTAAMFPADLLFMLLNPNFTKFSELPSHWTNSDFFGAAFWTLYCNEGRHIQLLAEQLQQVQIDRFCIAAIYLDDVRSMLRLLCHSNEHQMRVAGVTAIVLMQTKCVRALLDAGAQSYSSLLPISEYKSLWSFSEALLSQTRFIGVSRDQQIMIPLKEFLRNSRSGPHIYEDIVAKWKKRDTDLVVKEAQDMKDLSWMADITDDIRILRDMYS